MISSTLFATLLAVVAVNTSPIKISKRQNITALTLNEIEAYTPFTHFASTAYCKPLATKTWTCGENCRANPDFIPFASDGNGSSVQFWYVGYSPSQGSVIVAHQGTDPTEIRALFTDVHAFQGKLNTTLFPGIPLSVKVHRGFRDEHMKTAEKILSAVRTTISQHSATKVTIVGHSLGAALALLDGIYLPLHIRGVTFRTIGYGAPRVGNQEFANYVDSHISFTHINNKKDFVPIIPGKSFCDYFILNHLFCYRHPSGEIHITESNMWLSCPGQDNPSTQCSVGDVPDVSEGNVTDHDGPYNGITMGC